MSKIGIVCVAGHLGKATVQALLGRGVKPEDIVVISRDQEIILYFEELGVNARQVGLSEMPLSVLEDVSQLMVISNPIMDPTLMIVQHSGVIYAAKQAGVKHIVYTSLANLRTTSLVGPVHRATEYTLITTGIPYTILRNSTYLEKVFNTDDVKRALSTGKLLSLSKGGNINAASRKDIALAAAVVLTTEGHENKTYNLTSPLPYTMKFLADRISALSGKKVEYVEADEAAVEDWLLDSGYDGDINEDSTATQVLFTSGFGDFFTDDLVRLIGSDKLTGPDAVILEALGN